MDNKPQKLTKPTYTRKIKTRVKNTRLARKMYPNFSERGDGMLVIEILGKA